MSQKFRPVFTSSQILLLLESVKLRYETEPTHELKSLYSYLKTFSIKIENGLVDSQYTTKSKSSISDDLGFSEAKLESPLQLRERIYNQYKNTPRIDIPQTVIREFDTYRWENELMTPEETIIFESSF
jgi:hypothetical protein